MKIILTGCTGTGKTTLGQRMQQSGLVERYIEEDWTWPEYRGDSREARQTTIDHSLEWLSKRAQLMLTKNTSLVFDRGSMDLLHCWAALQYTSPQAWWNMHQHSASLLQNIDLVILFPWQSRNAKHNIPAANEDGQKRNMGGYADIKTQSQVLGICHQLLPASKILQLPYQPTTTDDRIKLIMRRILHLRSKN